MHPNLLVAFRCNSMKSATPSSAPDCTDCSFFYNHHCHLSQSDDITPHKTRHRSPVVKIHFKIIFFSQNRFLTPIVIDLSSPHCVTPSLVLAFTDLAFYCRVDFLTLISLGHVKSRRAEFLSSRASPFIVAALNDTN